MPRSLGVTSLQILGSIRDGVTYGLDIVTRTGMPSGTVYPTLGRLRKSGLIKARWEDQRVAEREGRPRRRYYDLTGDGVQALADGTSRITSLAAELRVEHRGQRSEGPPTGLMYDLHDPIVSCCCLGDGTGSTEVMLRAAWVDLRESTSLERAR